MINTLTALKTPPYPLFVRGGTIQAVVTGGTTPALAGWLGIALLTVVYLLPLLAALRPVTDTDIWWHLRAGQWIVAEQTLPQTEPFCGPCADKAWIAYSWLYEVLVYGLYSALGLTGILLFRVAMCLAIVACLHRLIARREPRLLTATALTVVASFAMLPLMTDRPWLVTILFAVVTMQVIVDVRAGKSSRLIWLLPGIYVLWANTHIQFVYGLFLLAIACAAPVVDALLGWEAAEDKCLAGSHSWRRLVGLALACALATLINPYHVGLYQVVWDYAAHEAPLSLIRELAALEFRSAWEWAALGLALASAFRLGRLKRLSSFQVLLLAGAAFFTFRSRRDVWLMALTAAVLIPDAKAHPSFDFRFALTRARLGTVSLVILALGVFIGWSKGLSEKRLQEAVAEAYPTDAVAAIEAQSYAGPLFNDYDWGGYLMWTLPRLKVSIDGRANLHGDHRLMQSAATWAGLPRWRNDPDLAAARVVIANKATALGALLRTDARFALVFEDAATLVFVNKQLEEAARDGSGPTIEALAGGPGR